MDYQINAVFLSGEVTRPVVHRLTRNGIEVANTTVKTTESWVDKKTNSDRKRYEWHKIVFWGDLATRAYKTMNVGDCISLEGALRTRKWINEADGTTKYFTEVHAKYFKASIPEIQKDNDRQLDTQLFDNVMSAQQDIPF